MATWLTQLLSWAATLLIARILTPTDYGIVGMATVYSAFIQLVNEFGLGAAIVQRRDLSDDQIARIGGFSTLTGLAFFGISAALATPIAAFFAEPRVRDVVIVVGITFVTTGMRTAPYALLLRDLQFKRIALIDTLQALILTVVTLVLALADFGYWSLVMGSVVGSAVGALAASRARPHPRRWPFPLASITQPLRFGFDLVQSRIAWYLYSNADIALIGRLLGTVALGTYSMAANIASIPVSKVYGLYQKVTGPVFAATQHDNEGLRRYLVALTEGIAFVTFPLSVGLALVAGPFVRGVLGEHWLAAVLPMQLLAVAAAFRSLDPILAQLLISTGHVRENKRTTNVALVTLPLLFLLGSRWGVVGVAAAWLVGEPLVVGLYQLRHVRRITGLDYGDYARSLWPAASSTTVMAVAVLLVAQATSGWAPLADLGARVATGGLAYGAAVWFLHRERAAERVALIRKLRERPA